MDFSTEKRNEMVKGIIEGDRTTLRNFYFIYAKLFRSDLIYKKGLSTETAEDLATTFADDILLKVIQGKFQNGKDANFNAWVGKVFYNMYVDWKRKNPNQQKIHAGISNDQALFHGAQKNSVITKAVQIGLEKLNAKDREVIVLKDINGNYTFEEIAKIVGSTANACKTRYHRAKKKLEAILKVDPQLAKYFANKNRVYAE
jgi:RNA polymerase sigma factor (sigma-70 family)